MFLNLQGLVGAGERYASHVVLRVSSVTIVACSGVSSLRINPGCEHGGVMHLGWPESVDNVERCPPAPTCSTTLAVFINK